MFKDTVLTMVQMALDDKVNDVFAAIQTELGITSGDVEPMDYMALETAQNALADVVAGIIAKQAKNNAADGERVFYNNETNKVETASEIYRDYYMESGENKRCTFDEYLNACMDYNNGALTEIQ